MRNLHNLLLELSSLKEFEFLHNTFILNKRLKNTVLTLDVNKISNDDKLSALNFFIDHTTESYYPINDKISHEFLKTLLFEKDFIIESDLFQHQIENSIINIILRTNIIKINKEIILFETLLHNEIHNFANDLFDNLLEIFIKEIVKNKTNLDNIKFKYTDMSFKLGEILIKFYLKNFNYDKFIKKNIFIYMLEKSEDLISFIHIYNKKYGDLSLEKLAVFFNMKDIKTVKYLYKLIRTFIIYKKYEKINKFPKEFSKIHYQYTTYMIKFGSLILESLIEDKIFSKNYLKLKNYTLKNTLVIIFNAKFLNIATLKCAIQRPYLTENSISKILDNSEYKLLKTHANSNFTNNLLYNIYNYREKNFIGHNFNMTTEIKNGSYLNNKNNLSTKFVIDIDYLYFFLNLLKYHMVKKNKDFNLPFIEQLKSHENIFLLYQITIDPIVNFYDRYKEIKIIKDILDQILIYILDYNINDNEHIKNYKKDFLNLKKNKEVILSSIEKKNIEIFINDLFNKIFSYKLFIKGLISECILYSNFRYFILDSFIDTRGRCYYNGFYLNPQSYPITKAFIKLYNPTHISEKQYSEVLYPTMKKHINNNIYQNILDKDLNTYTKFINKQNSLKEDYLNSLLNTHITINKDIIENFRYIKNPIELSIKILDFIKPKINKIKKLYIVHSMFIRILYPQKEIQNYYELDAVASGLQMTAMLFQNKKLAKICNLITEQENQIDIYDESSSFLIRNLDILDNNLNKMFIRLPDFITTKHKLITIYNRFLDKEIDLSLLITETKVLIGKIENLFESIEELEKFYTEHHWIITKSLQKNNSKTDEENLYYLTILKGLKMNILRKEFMWLDDWIKSRDFFKKSIMTYGYNATEYRRKEEWMSVLLKLNNYEKRTDLLFITDVAENLFTYITLTQLTPSNWLRKLGTIIKDQIELNISKEELSETTTLNAIIENPFLKMQIHCYRQINKRINVKGLENKRKHQLTIKCPIYIKKEFKNSKGGKNIYLLKQQNYSLLNRKFSPNFIHSMDAFLVHIFKQKIFEFSISLKKNNILINHMTNHDNFSLTLEPFLKILLMDCYNLVYKYDYINTLNNMDFFNIINNFKLDCQKVTEDLLPVKFNEKKDKLIPSDINLSNNFVK